MVNSMELPKKIYLAEYGGNYERNVDAVYEVFERDFIRHRAMFGSYGLRMKYHPEFQGRAYTFYHMTHKGEVESERLSDLRRCECMPWARPSVDVNRNDECTENGKLSAQKTVTTVHKNQ